MVMWKGFVPDAPVAILTKIPVAAAGMSAIGSMALTLRPRHVLIAGAGTALTLIGFYGLAVLDPSTTFASFSINSYFGPAISRARLVTELIFVAGVTSATAMAAHLARQTIRQAARLQRTTDQLSRYFSPDIAAGIRDGGEAFMQPGGREQEVVVLFSDLAGFTRLCVGLSASQALMLLSEYQERMVAEIFRAGGTLDKFIGDGIMATFGTPVPADDAADRAVQAARGMNTALAALNAERGQRGLPLLSQRIGIHAGLVAVGNVGTAQRLEFTVIGDAVNVASRIEGACKTVGRTAMISAAVVARLRQATDLEAIGLVALEGQPAPLELFALR
jgi:adenylate cyclase